MNYKHVAYLFCRDLHRDPVSKYILDRLLALPSIQVMDDRFDGRPIHRWLNPETGLMISIAESEEVVSHDYPRYLPELNRCFSNCDFVGLVNWHEGANAPNRILCLHTTGDVPSGQFGNADPTAFSALLRAFSVAAQRSGCGYTSLSEATHWSGMAFAGKAEQIGQFSVPVMDLEIGSTPAAWSDPAAHEALTAALIEFPAHLTPAAPAILCVGGIHFESAFNAPLLGSNAKAYHLAHILPNQWLSVEHYTGSEGTRRLLAAASSTRGGIQAIVFHDNLKGAFKESARAAAAHLEIPAFNHKVLRDPVRFVTEMSALGA